jgi:hypothetical protein
VDVRLRHSTASFRSDKFRAEAFDGSAAFMEITSHMSTSPDENTDLVKESLLYKEFLAEREEILRHKWIESEKAGHDVGFEKALLDWIVKHRSSWRTQRQQEGTMH